MAELSIKVNGRMWPVTAAPDTPLLYVLTNELELRGPRFGCGLAQCGSCSVLADGVEIRSCVTPVANVAGKAITTLEGLPGLYAEQKGLAQAPAAASLHRRPGAALRLLLQRHDHQRRRVAGDKFQAERRGNSRGTYPQVMQAIKLASTRMAGGTR